MKATIYQVYFNKDQRLKLDPQFIPYDNSESNSPFFENEVILKLIATGMHLNCDYFGVVSWMFGYKTKSRGNEMSSTRLFEMLELNKTYDVMSVFGFHPIHNLFVHGGHGTIMPKLIERILTIMGHQVDVYKFKPAMLVYENHVFCRPDVYESYVREMLLPAYEIMCDVTDAQTQTMLWADSKYKRNYISKADKDRFKKMFAVPYYPHHAFVCERLFSYWLTINQNKYSFKQLI